MIKGEGGNMDLRSLRIFQAVAEYGTVSAAAKELNYVQSNVTAHIKQLENHLQTPLFYRKHKGMVLNPEGRKMLQQVNQILQQVTELERTFLEHDTPSGTLKIGTVEIVSILPEILATYYNAYPNVDLSLEAGLTEQLIQKVLNHELDGAFISGPIQHEMLRQYTINKEELVLVTSSQAFNVEELTTMPLLVSNEGCGYRAKLTLWLKALGIRPKRIMEFNIMETILKSVILGLGATIVPASMVEQLTQEKRVYCHKIPAQYATNITLFIHRKDQGMTATMASFLTHLQHADEQEVHM